MNQPVQFNYTVRGDKDKPALIWLHGFMGSSADWDEVVSLFSAAHFCIAIDLPGHGMRLASRPEDYAMETCAENLVSFLDEMGIDRACLIGYSMGGRLAFYLAVNYQGRFKAIVVESASPGLKTAEERRERVEHDRKLAQKIMNSPLSEFIDEWYQQPLFTTIDTASGRFHELIQRRLRNDPEALSMSLLYMGTGSQSSLWDKLGQITTPMLLIAGQHDAKFSTIASEVVELCPAARMVTIDNAGHNVHFENPEEYARQISLFLDNIRKD